MCRHWIIAQEESGLATGIFGFDVITGILVGADEEKGLLDVGVTDRAATHRSAWMKATCEAMARPNLAFRSCRSCLVET